MMGHHEPQKDLFSYHINLDKRVPRDHPLRQIAAKIDFEFVRAEVEKCYGSKGNVSVDPVVILKMMFLLFYDDVPSERELMKVLGFRLDYLWFLGYSLDNEIPNHSVLSKARKRWGPEVFASFFIRVVTQCVEAGLVEWAPPRISVSKKPIAKTRPRHLTLANCRTVHFKSACLFAKGGARIAFI